MQWKGDLHITGDANLLAQVARIWLVLPGNVDDASLLKMVLTQVQSPFAARSVWEQLADEERRLLYAVLEDKDRAKGVPLARLQKKTRLLVISTKSEPVFGPSVSNRREG